MSRPINKGQLKALSITLEILKKERNLILNKIANLTEAIEYIEKKVGKFKDGAE